MSWITPIKPMVAPWVKRSRALARRLTGLQQELDERLATLENRLSVLTDRVGIAETIVQWRLHGIPKRMENLKLEEAPLLAGAGDVERALKTLSSLTDENSASSGINGLPESVSKALVFAGDRNEEYREIRARYPSAHLWVVDDEGDLFRTSPHLRIAENDLTRSLRVREPSAAALLAGERWDLVWLSSALERLSPVQTTVLLQRAAASRAQGGVVAGYFADFARLDPGAYFADPRRLRPLSVTFVGSIARACGFEHVEFEPESAWVRFRLS